MAPIALYYPYIHVRDEEWLKYAALYWPKMGRLRPPEYETSDSPTARVLRDELDWLVDVVPVEDETSDLFLQLLAERAEELRQRYGLHRVEAWERQPETTFYNISQVVPGNGEGSRGGLDPRPSYIHVFKADQRFIVAAEDAGLAEVVRGMGGDWIGMHPRLASVYTCALVDRIAERGRMHPVTDQVLPHTAVSGWTVERVAEVLLGEHWTTGPDDHDPQDVLSAYLLAAFRTVVPKGLADVPAEKIVQLRADFGPELDAFRGYVADEVARLSELRDVRDLTAFREHIATEVQQTVAGHVQHLRERIRDAGLETAKALMHLKFSLPPLAMTATSMAGLSPSVTVPAAVATSIGAVSSRFRRERQRLARESPVGYLLRVGDAIEPAGMTERVRAAMRTAWPK